MKEFTVILGDFADFPGVWNDVHVTAESVAEVDVEACARKAFDELCVEHPTLNDLGTPLPDFTLVGIYPGHISNMGVY